MSSAINMATLARHRSTQNRTMYQRQYRTFEDLTEPCWLMLTRESIIVTYQMKSIICEHRWDHIKHIKTDRLSSKPSSSAASSSSAAAAECETISKSDHNQSNATQHNRFNIIRIRFNNDQIKSKQYRFDSRIILDEFLSEAIRIDRLSRIMTRSFLLFNRIKYVPIVSPDDELFYIDDRNRKKNTKHG